MRTNLEFLQKRLCLSPDKIKSTLIQRASLLKLSSSAIEAKIEAVRHEAGMNDEEARSFFQRGAQVLLMGSENTLAKIAFVRSRLRLTGAELKKLLLAMPHVAAMNSERNFEPKVAFIEGLLGAEATKDYVVRSPQILAASLHKRLIPRLLQLRLEAPNIGESTEVEEWTTLLDDMRRKTDEKWDEVLRRKGGREGGGEDGSIYYWHEQGEEAPSAEEIEELMKDLDIEEGEGGGEGVWEEEDADKDEIDEFNIVPNPGGSASVN
ncbi:hypothetical protein TeGR_g3646 [Tetraparma gracilis]|uniref:Uncharacterized protein n=1 Tax=Tetraparma gracilis TaxID=2962635 RepID=A0ABQ6M9X6_9STRA|nr:hypothetical protein TeGR_g3646 [Tetraparma gracilis]